MLKLLLYRTHYIQHNRRRWSVWNVGVMGSNFQEPYSKLHATMKLSGIGGTWDNMGVDDFSKLLEQLTYSYIYVCVCVCVWYMRENYTKKPISQPKIYNPNMKRLMLSKCAKNILIFFRVSFMKKNYGDLRTPILLENKKMFKNKNMTIVWLILIIVRNASQVQLLFFAMSYFDWPITKKIKKLKLGWFPQNRRFYCKMECLPLWLKYIGEMGRTLGKNIWD